MWGHHLSKTFTKTIRLRLREPNAKKREKIEKAMEESTKAANEASKRMPSLSMKYIRHPKAKDNPFWSIVKDLKKEGLDLNTACIHQSIDKARSAYLSEIENNNFDTTPKFETSFVRLHNRDNIDKFFESDGTKYVSLKLFPYEKITIPFYPGDYQNYFLKKIINEDLDYGAGEIINYDYGYSLNLTIKKEVDLKYDAKTFIGVDLGLNVLAWAVALDEDKEFLDEIHFDGGEAGWIRNRFWKKRKRLQEDGKLDLVKKLEDRENRWMENKNHVISRRIVDFANQFDNPVMILEDINLNQLRDRVENPKIDSWRAGDLRNMILYKATEEEIRTHEVNPKNTSRECPKCEHISKSNRDGISFKCQECGYTNHADFVGAWNIAKS